MKPFSAPRGPPGGHLWPYAGHLGAKRPMNCSQYLFEATLGPSWARLWGPSWRRLGARFGLAGAGPGPPRGSRRVLKSIYESIVHTPPRISHTSSRKFVRHRSHCGTRPSSLGHKPYFIMRRQLAAAPRAVLRRPAREPEETSGPGAGGVSAETARMVDCRRREPAQPVPS